MFSQSSTRLHNDPAVDAGGGNPARFSGFADIYDANRPSPPNELGPLLASYANVAAPVVVDLGSGTGLSSRWAATWAASVVGVEPSDDMRTVAESRPTAGGHIPEGLVSQHRARRTFR